MVLTSAGCVSDQISQRPCAPVRLMPHIRLCQNRRQAGTADTDGGASRPSCRCYENLRETALGAAQAPNSHGRPRNPLPRYSLERPYARGVKDAAAYAGMLHSPNVFVGTTSAEAYAAGVDVIDHLSSALGVEGESAGGAQLSQKHISLASRRGVLR